MEFATQALSIFHKGGPVMYLLRLCSASAVTIAAESFIYYRNSASGRAIVCYSTLPVSFRLN